MKYTLSAPAKSGMRANFDTFGEALAAAADILDVDDPELVEIDGETKSWHCYRDEAEAAAADEWSGAYDVKIIEAR